MKRSRVHAALLALLAMGCGGGGSIESPPGGGIALLSITFPKYTDLKETLPAPPSGAPLSQQVVFNFSGPVSGEVSSRAIQILGDPGASYSGPDGLLDKTKWVLPARGTFQVEGNRIVFTPFIPIREIDLTPNAGLENVPGLLPGTTYTVFVPLGTAGAIENLVHVESGVDNPLKFKTISPTLPSLFFVNHPARPPRVKSTDPADGATDVLVPTLSDDELSSKGILLEFDEPLDFNFDNLEGTDLTGNGVRDQNLFLEYCEPTLFMAVDESPMGDGCILGLDLETDEMELVGYTTTGCEKVGLKSIVLTESHGMIGCDGRRLFEVLYEEAAGSPPLCLLTRLCALNGVVEAGGLALTRGGALYALDAGAGSLVKIDPLTGAVEKKGALPAAYGIYRNLAVGRDDELYALRVFDPGSMNAVSFIDRIDRDTMKSFPAAAGVRGDFAGLFFSGDGCVVLFEIDKRQWVELDLNLGRVTASGRPVIDPLLPPCGRPDLCMKRYELGVTPKLLKNDYQGALVRIEPSGILPFGSRIDIMQRFSLENLSGGSMAKSLGMRPLGALSAGSFITRDPGPEPMDDRFLEDFLDNDFEDPKHEDAQLKAVWNVQDHDFIYPEYAHLLAGLGVSGGGELGDLKPHPMAAKTVMLDTDHQPFPLLDGSTPDILEPLSIAGGEFHFHDIIIPEGVTLMARGSNPLVLTATGRVEIRGTIDVTGARGGMDDTFNSAFVPNPGGVGGPGGGRGGMGQPPVPHLFSALTHLQSVPRGERGWGSGNLMQIGGGGGESGAKGIDVAWKAQDPDPASRGAGGGGGSFAVAGHAGHPGRGRYGVDETGAFYVREPWHFWDGSWEWDGTGHWKPGDPYTPKTNEFFIADDYRHPKPGEGGDEVFRDDDPDNNFIGELGEINTIQGGQGGGAGGSRLDSMSDDPKGPSFLAPRMTPPKAPSAFDAKGGGGGGGGGAVAVLCLGEIVVAKTGRILARGGRGGGGEVNGASNFGGGGGGGSGGAVILNSGTRILIEHEEDAFGELDVSGGWGGDASQHPQGWWIPVPDPCVIVEYLGKFKYPFLCSWSIGDGGAGGYGLIQLMVPDPSDVGQLDFKDDSIMASLCRIEHEPSYKKTEGVDGFAYYHFSIEGLGPGGTKPFVRRVPQTCACLVPPDRTLSSIGPCSFAVSKWIDMGRVIDRPPVGKVKAPVLLPFQGIREEGGWGIVETRDNCVKGARIEDLNDIAVDAPDLGLKDYIPDANEVAIQFQATDALVPGSKIPDESPAVMSEWTWDPSCLSGRQFVRFRIRFDIARGGLLSPQSSRPQVNFVRMRIRY